MLAIADHANINNHIRYHRRRIEGRQLRVRASDDMKSFVRARSQFPGYIHPAFDPDMAALPEGSAFWVSVETPAGEVVACAATRKFDNARLLDLFMSRQVWYSKCAVIDDMDPLEIDWPQEALAVEGTLAIHGSLIVRDDFRKGGLGTHLIRMVRAASLRSWRQDWNFGLVRAELEATAFQARRYGYPFTCRAFERRPDWGPKHDVEFLNLISQRDMLAEYAKDPENLGL